MSLLVLHELILIASVVLGAAFGVWLAKDEAQRGYSRDLPLVGDGFSGTLGIAGGSVAFILGLLLIFAVEQYSDADSAATDEALAYAAAFTAAANLDSDQRDQVMRDLVCLMRSIKYDAWAAAQKHDLTGSDNERAWTFQVQKSLVRVADESRDGRDTLGLLESKLLDAQQAGQKRLLFAKTELPWPIWPIIHFSIFITSLLIASALHANASLMLVSLTCHGSLTGIIVAALVVFSGPFDGVGHDLEPAALDSVLIRLENLYPGQFWSPCPRLAVER